ncbi:MAG TPA: chromate transporter [Terriglobia bacterium]|nr:chromate transporter [Terriglobia bacterium]
MLPLTQVAVLFLRLGAISFGGPAAHIALMEDEVVRRRRWLSHEEFMDLVGATNLIPGPNSTELALHIGLRKAGWPGFFVAGGCFILPATLIVIFCAWLYVRYGSLPEAGGILYGVKPVMIAVVLQALWALGRAALKTKTLLLLAMTAATLNFLGVNELVILFGAGLLFAFTRSPFLRKSQTQYFSLAPLFLFFLKTGSVLFGSGYVLLAFLRADLVERWHWLSEAQLLDAIAVGQFTPGPVFTTATFIGYILARTPGAIVATLGIFLPAFVFVALSGPFIPRIRRSETAGAFLDAVNAASLALMAVVTWQLGHSALVDATTLVLAVAGAIMLFRFRVNSAWIVLGGALVGLARI